jgi:hypothetical protein
MSFASCMSTSIKHSNASNSLHPKNKRHVILSAAVRNTSPKHAAKDLSFFIGRQQQGIFALATRSLSSSLRRAQARFGSH